MSHPSKVTMKVLFVCYANQFRSPTAELLFRYMTDHTVRSAGIGALTCGIGAPIRPEMHRLLTKHEGDLGQSTHEAQQFTLEMSEWADVVVAMDLGLRFQLTALTAMQTKQSWSLIIMPNPGKSELGIPDLEVGASDAFFEQSYLQIKTGCEWLAENIDTLFVAQGDDLG